MRQVSPLSSLPLLCFSGSDDDDDDEVPALPSIYPLSRYEDAGVVASMNGLHAQLNGGGENTALKHEVGLWSFLMTGEDEASQ